MFRYLSCLIIALFTISAANAVDITALKGGRIIDGNGGAPIVDGVILMDGERIIAVGNEDDINIPTGTKIIDTNGMTVMPGLIDIHVHFDILGHSDYNHWFGKYENRMRSDIMPAAAKAMLMAGVTSVRDLGADVSNIFWLRDQVNSGKIPGPRTFIAGPFLRKTATAFVSDGYKDTWVIESPEDAREKVRKLKEMGADVIKTQDEALSQEELAAIYDEAHKQGLRVASHIYAAEAIRTALKAGIGEYDTIEHIGEYEATAYDDDIVQMILDQKVAMAATIIARDGLRQIIENPELTDDPRWIRDLPADLYADVRKSYREVDLTDHPLYDKASAHRAGRMAKLRQLKEAGAIFTVSTDSGTRANPHHDAMWKEMVLMQEETGMTNMEVLVAATKTNALVMQQQDKIGTLEAGKLADIIIVDGDPLSHLSDMRRVKHVIKGGVLFR
ncbi:amidohydrolase family protein [Kordiimonas aquimaris]|uniref:amidohydrolase family protein n=1 Tax=Kordiimonas aquimaris TaxID=707591 RepID=UPI0021D0F777|nr:amidohydrolase family protein [Kordiimonas aquimaris]